MSLSANLFGVLAIVTLTVHLLWIAWVIFGWVVTRNRPVLRWLHILSLVYGILIEILPWPCPLTLAEQWFEAHAGMEPYHQPFLVHYLEAVVYPDVSPRLLRWCGVAVCLLILGIYARRLRQRRVAGW